MAPYKESSAHQKARSPSACKLLRRDCPRPYKPSPHLKAGKSKEPSSASLNPREAGLLGDFDMAKSGRDIVQSLQSCLKEGLCRIPGLGFRDV